ncbi:MAG TPA: acyl-CoA thioesterase, partial [Candidatus Binatia bacterium]
IQIETQLAEIGRVSLSFNYRISREMDNGLVAVGSTKHACVDHSGHVTRIPQILADALKAASA